MPLKPIYEKSPLTVLNAVALRPGQVRMEHAAMEQVYQLLAGARNDHAAWEGMIRLGAVLGKTEVPAAAWTRLALDMQDDKGGLPLSLPQSLAVIRAAMALYEQTTERDLVEKMMKWCAFLAANWEDVAGSRAIRVSTADLMEVLLALYRITGKKAVLNLCEKLRQTGMDWSGVLHTFAVQRSMARVTPWSDMEAGMDAEQCNEEGFYTRQYLTCHAEHLADGVRAAQANGLFSGNGMELSAGKTGWERISRYHGAVCGGLTADETVAGASSASAVDAAALGAWAEALAAQAVAVKDPAWAFDALETLTENGLPAAIVGGLLVPFQRVNGLDANCGTKDCYHIEDANGNVWRALSRLSRGWAAAASSAVTVVPAGAQIGLYLPGSYTLVMNGAVVCLEVKGGDGRYDIEVKGRKAVKASLALRVPSWTDDACIAVNGEGADEGKPGKYLTLEREWQPGDVIHVSFGLNLRAEAGHHQSATVLLGAKVMAMKADRNDWARVLCGEPEMRDGQVVVKLARTAAWRAKGAVPADVPVLPDTEGEAVETVLTPYAETPSRIAVFPRGQQA